MIEAFLTTIQKKVQYKTIMIFSWTALGVCALSSFFFYFISYDNELSFPYLAEWFSLLWDIAPFVLLTLYLKKFYNQCKATIIIPTIFAIFGLTTFFSIFSIIFSGALFSSLLLLVVKGAFVVFCVLSISSALKGLHKKEPVVLAMFLGVLSELCSLTSRSAQLEFLVADGEFFTIFAMYAFFVALILLHLAILFFVSKYRIPVLTSSSKTTLSASSSPEKVLISLNHKLELGLISEEEYQAQRAEIISKL